MSSTYEQDMASTEALAAANEPVHARDLSCQGLANVDPSYSKPIFRPGVDGQYVIGYAEKMTRLGEGHVYGCDLMGHGIEDWPTAERPPGHTGRVAATSHKE
jgi:hypothetical protein